MLAIYSRDFVCLTSSWLVWFAVADLAQESTIARGSANAVQGLQAHAVAGLAANAVAGLEAHAVAGRCVHRVHTGKLIGQWHSVGSTLSLDLTKKR